MKKFKRIFTILLLAALLISVLCVPAFALTESEVEAQVAATSKSAVTGNVLIWFLCAVAFLKVSQKIDSFMASLGVNVGHTGGSLLAEAMIAMRAVTMSVGGGHGAGANRTGSASGSPSGNSGGGGMAGFFRGGLIGMAGRHITNSAVRTATTQTSAVHTAQNQAYQAAAATAAAAETASEAHINNDVHTGGSSIHTDNTVPTGTPPQDGVIVTGGGVSAPVPPMESVPSASPVPDAAPPQDGVILAGSEAPVSIPADPAPQIEGAPLEGMPLESMPVDMTPPDGGVVITGGDTAIHASQTENTTQSNTVGSTTPRENAASIGGQRTETHTEHASQTVQTATSSERVQTSHYHSSVTARPTLGGMIFSRSLAAGGSFANDVIGTVARGEVAGSITGDMAAQSLQSYLGYTAQGGPPPIFTDAEIGRGRITGQVSTPDHPQPIAFGLYHADQYAEPKGAFTKVRSADGTLWYSQLAQDTVERKPYNAPDGTVAYKERIVKKLPDPPKRKDRI